MNRSHKYVALLQLRFTHQAVKNDRLLSLWNIYAFVLQMSEKYRGNPQRWQQDLPQFKTNSATTFIHLCEHQDLVNWRCCAIPVRWTLWWGPSGSLASHPPGTFVLTQQYCSRGGTAAWAVAWTTNHWTTGLWEWAEQERERETNKVRVGRCSDCWTSHLVMLVFPLFWIMKQRSGPEEDHENSQLKNRNQSVKTGCRSRCFSYWTDLLHQSFV